ncbi:MAG TPA: CocE/NonD family hydrolase [Spirochaetota bacterium]|nr:CocE/NonD family hydrolase [Spirochaetota bacterium]
MRKNFIACVLFFLLGLAAVVSTEARAGGTLDESVKTEIEGDLAKAGILGCVVDINQRIDVPVSENPYIESSQYADDEAAASLWALVIKTKRALTTPQPTILMATAYRREIMGAIIIPMVSYGYNVVVVDMRGSGSSEGHWNAMSFIETYDVKYVIDRWIPSQSWSDGKVGMVGPSYMGILQMLVAGIVDVDENGEPEHFKASVAHVPFSDVYADITMHGGNFDLEFITFWILLTETLSSLPGLTFLGEDAQLPYYAVNTDLDNLQEAVSELLTSINNYTEPFYDLILLSENDFRNDDFQQRSPFIFWPDKPVGGWNIGDYNEGERVFPSKLPTVITGGWFDIFTRGCLNQYTYGLKNHSDSDKALIVGDWYHADGSMMLGVNSALTGAFYARWFNWKIRGEEDCFMKEYPVMIRVMGTDRWRAEKSWPLPESRVSHKSLYFSKKEAEPIEDDDFTNDSDNQIYSLEWNKSDCDLDSDNPVMKHTAVMGALHGENSRSSARWLMGIPALIAQVSKFYLGYNIDSARYFEDERSDDWKIPTFTTEPLEEDVEIVGPVCLKFWAKTDFRSRGVLEAAFEDWIFEKLGTMFGLDLTDGVLDRGMYQNDVQFVAELDDVFENGRARNITSGWLRASHRQRDDGESSSTTEHALDPDYTAFDPFYLEPDYNPELITEGELYEYSIELWPTCNVFKAGHRIRVTLTGSDWPHLLPILIPSWNEIVIDDDHEARIDFTMTNTQNEGKTWKWLTDESYGHYAFDQYLLNHEDTPDADTSSSSGGSSSSGTISSTDADGNISGDEAEDSSSFNTSTSVSGCGSDAEASVMAGGKRPLLPGLFSTLIMMLIPLGFMGLHRRIRKKR